MPSRLAVVLVAPIAMVVCLGSRLRKGGRVRTSFDFNGHSSALCNGYFRIGQRG